MWNKNLNLFIALHRINWVMRERERETSMKPVKSAVAPYLHKEDVVRPEEKKMVRGEQINRRKRKVEKQRNGMSSIGDLNVSHKDHHSPEN